MDRAAGGHAGVGLCSLSGLAGLFTGLARLLPAGRSRLLARLFRLLSARRSGLFTRLTGLAGLSAHAGIADDHIRLRRIQIHAHTAAAACRQNGTTGNGDGAVRIQRLVVGGVGAPNHHRSAGNGQITVGIKSVSCGGVGMDTAAGNIHRELKISQIRIGGVQTIVGRLNGDIAGKYIQRCGLQSLVTAVDGNGGTGRAGFADVQRVVAVDGIVCCIDRQLTAAHRQGGFGVDPVVHRCADGERQILNRHPRFAFGVGGDTGFNTVFAVRRHREGAGTAQRHFGAILAFDNGVFRIFIIGIVVVVVGSCIRQCIDRTVRRHDCDLRGFVAGDGRSVRAGQRQPVQHQCHAGRTFFHRDGTVGAAAGHGVGTGFIDGQCCAFHFVSGIIAVCGIDTGIRKDKAGSARGIIAGGGGERHGHPDHDQRQRSDRRQKCRGKFGFFHGSHPFQNHYFSTVPSASVMV